MILYGDIHNHNAHGYGVGSIERSLEIARTHLDFFAFTGHSSWHDMPSMEGQRERHWIEGYRRLKETWPRVQQVMSGGQVVKSGYRNPLVDPIALQAERLLLKTVVSALKSHPALGLWNLGNEPALFAWPPSADHGRAWVSEMAELIRSIDEVHPLTCGLHMASLVENNGFRVDQVFRATDVAVMHAHPMYVPQARHPLGPGVVPFTCALVSALCGKPTLMEEFGGCTTPDDGPSQTWEWTAFGQPRTQFMASEDDFAQYVAAVLPRLIEVGATGALLWCFADYDRSLWQQPPCDEARHERHFGLLRPAGSIKPHAAIVRDFAATGPVVKEAVKRVSLPISPDEFYGDPFTYTFQLYREFVGEV